MATATVVAPGNVSTAGSVCQGNNSYVRLSWAFANTYLRGRQVHQFTVTTRTSYGWTSESPRTAGLYC